MFTLYTDGRVLYRPGDKAYALLSPKLVLEWGKAGSLNFKIPNTNRSYERLFPFRSRITAKLDDEEIFRGRVLTISRGFDNTRTVCCEGDLAYLVDSVQPGTQFNGKAHDLLRRFIASHNAQTDDYKRFVVGEITADNPDIIIVGKTEEGQETEENDYKQIAIDSMPDKRPTSFDAIETCLINEVGGDLRTRRDADTIYIDWLKEHGGRAVQTIRFGKNLLDLIDESADVDDIFSVLIPLGDDGLTIASVNGGSDELVDGEAVELYGGRIVRTHVFDGVTTPETLLENAQRYMELHTKRMPTIRVKAVDIHLIDPCVKAIHIGDRVHVLSEPHGLSEEMTCTRIEYDLENPANDVYTFGTPKSSLTERYRKDKKQTASDITSSGRSGGGGSGSAAAEEAQKQLDKFYDAYINLDPSAGHIDLGTVYKEFQNEKTVLEQTCGISIDAPAGNINIRSLRKEFDDLGTTVRETNAYIDVLNNETKAQIEMVTSNHNKLKEQEEEHYASFRLFATDTESAIEGKADRFEMDAVKQDLIGTTQQVGNIGDVLTREVGIHLDGTTGNVNIGSLANIVDEHGVKIAENSAAIQTTANELTAQIEAEAKVSTANGTKIAKLTLRADAADQSLAEIQADLTKITGRLEVGDTTTVKGGLYATGSIGAAGSIVASGGFQLAGGSFKIENKTFSAQHINLVTDFTQASTPGYTANPVSRTLLAASIGNGKAMQPLAGSVTKIN